MISIEHWMYVINVNQFFGATKNRWWMFIRPLNSYASLLSGKVLTQTTWYTISQNIFHCLHVMLIVYYMGVYFDYIFPVPSFDKDYLAVFLEWHHLETNLDYFSSFWNFKQYIKDNYNSTASNYPVATLVNGRGRCSVLYLLSSTRLIIYYSPSKIVLSAEDSILAVQCLLYGNEAMTFMRHRAPNVMSEGTSNIHTLSNSSTVWYRYWCYIISIVVIIRSTYTEDILNLELV